MKPTPDAILYVDDEEQALKYFRMTFAKDYEVLTATNADDAWGIFTREAERLALVVSDQRMPGKQGVDLLTAMRERDSRVVRLLTTAYSELGSAIEAVNKGAVYAYITKPWKIDELRLVIRRAVEFRHLQRERDALLAEKLSVMQDLLLSDRLRGAALVVSGLAGRVGAPFAAVAAWGRSGLRPAPVIRGDGRDSWPEVVGQTRELAELGRDLSRSLAGLATGAQEVDLASLAGEASGLPVSGGPVRVRADGALLKVGLAALVRCLRSAGNGADLDLQASAEGGATLRIGCRAGQGPGTGSPESDGLLAHLAVHHHGGSIDLGSWQDGSGTVLVRLPAEPAAGDDGLDAMITFLSEQER